MNRRHFIRTATTAAPALSLMEPARRLFGRDLSRTSSASPDWWRRADEYMLGDGITYLNHASIGTMPRAVLSALERYLRLCESNPWLYMWDEPWQQPREDLRFAAAELVGCEPSQMALLHNTTEAFNIMAQGLGLGPGDEVLFGSLNHVGASAAFFHQAETDGYRVRRFEVPLDLVPEWTEVDILNLYDNHIAPDTRVLVLPHVDNTVGLRHPLRTLSELAKDRGVEYVAVDAAQTVGMLPINISGTDVDLFATSSHKWLQSPKGLGLTFVSDALQDAMRPMWVTWGKTRWSESARKYEDYGTRNFPELLAMSDALAFNRAVPPKQREQRLRQLWEHTRSRAESTNGTSWRSPTTWDLSASLYAIGIEGHDSREVFERFYRDNGLVFRPFRTASLNAARLSPNVFTTEEDIDRFFDLFETL